MSDLAREEIEEGRRLVDACREWNDGYAARRMHLDNLDAWLHPRLSAILAMAAECEGAKRELADANALGLSILDDRDAAIRERDELRREVERLRDCVKRAGLECYVRGGTPDEVADFMRRLIGSWKQEEEDDKRERDRATARAETAEAEVARLRAELARERVGEGRREA